MAVVVDTHTFIWYLCASNRLSETAIATLDQTIQMGDFVYIASISIVEIAYLLREAEFLKMPLSN